MVGVRPAVTCSLDEDPSFIQREELMAGRTLTTNLMPDKNHIVITGGIGLIAVVLAVVFVSGNQKGIDTLSANVIGEKEEQDSGDTVTNSVTPMVTQKIAKNVTVSPSLSLIQSPAVSIMPTMSPLVSPTYTAIPMVSSTRTPTPTPTKTLSPSVSPTRTPTLTPSPSLSVAPTPSPSLTLSPTDTPGDTSPPRVVFSEIAWMGTQASSADEWMELFNVGTTTADMAGWKIQDGDGNTVVSLSGIIDLGAYFLIERTDQQTVKDIEAQITSPFGGSGLSNGGEKLILFDNNNNVIDSLDCSGGWFVGEASPGYKSMERKSASTDSNYPANWGINNGIIRNGMDAAGNLINGTPGARNSVAID